MDRKLVLDISHWDGDINLKEWKSRRGLWGVIIKAGGYEKSLGRYKDSTFDKNYKKAIEAGIHIGFYYYTISVSTVDSKADAEHFASLIAGKKYDLPCYMDVEDPNQFKLSKRALTDVISTFCETLKHKGYYPGLYTGGSAWKNNVYSEELTKYANWIAWWRANWPYEAGDIGLWQQGGIRLSDGNIVYDDVPGYHDCNWCVVDYPAKISQNSSDTNVENSSDVSNSQNEKSNGPTASDVINAAYGELGYYAPNDPERGSKYGRWMAQVTGEDWMAGPSVEIWWCCMFVSWCLNKAGVKMTGFPSQNTDMALKNGAKKYAVDKKSVQYGDIVIFNWDWDSKTDHIGFATGSFDGNGFPTIEGNVGNAVKEKYRQMGNVAYILRPPYESLGNPTETITVSTEPRNNRDGGTLEVDGIGGWNTIIDWQNQIGCVENGWIRGQKKTDKEYHSNMSNVVYDDYGSVFVGIIQKKIGATVTGFWTKETSEKLQEKLVSMGYSVGSDGIDGYFGINSVKALQQSLNDKKWIE